MLPTWTVAIFLLFFLLSAQADEIVLRINETFVVPENPPLNGYCKQDINHQIPYFWFCHEKEAQITVTDPFRRSVPLQKLGNFHFSEGEHVYHFKVKNSGTYVIRANKEVVSTISTHPEHCFCPENWENFKKRFQCKDFDARVVKRLLSRWLPNSVTLEDFEKLKKFGGRRGDYMRISIVNNRLFYQVKLPDCEFVHTYAYDGPSIPFFETIPPTIAQGFNENFAEIPGPTGSLLKWIKNGRPVEFAASSPPWKVRKSMAYFRGSLTGKAIKNKEDLKYNFRMRLVMMAQNNSKIDAKILLRTPEGRGKRGALEPPYTWVPEGMGTTRRSARDALKNFKYVLNADGNAAAWRMYYQMATGAAIIKQRSPWEEWWYRKLVPEVNIMETGRYFEDMSDIVDYLAENDEKAEKIARNAFHTWAQDLRAEDTYCWVAHILKGFSEKLDYKVEVRKGMKEAERPNDPAQSCHCQYGEP